MSILTQAWKPKNVGPKTRFQLSLVRVSLLSPHSLVADPDEPTTNFAWMDARRWRPSCMMSFSRENLDMDQKGMMAFAQKPQPVTEQTSLTL